MSTRPTSPARLPAARSAAATKPRPPARSASIVDAGKRFAERARRRRRGTWRRAVVAALLVAAVVLAGWVVLASPLLDVEQVEVTGTQRVPASAVSDLAGTAVGVPLARLDLSRIEGSVEELVGVRDATVTRSWPSALVVDVVERVPLAAVPGASGGYGVVDAEGVTLETVPEPPAGLPLLEVDVTVTGTATLQEVVSVVGALPEDLRAQVGTAGATTRDSVTLEMVSGATVVWGSADESALKSRVLQALLHTPAEVYDVSAPQMPVTR